MKNIKVVTTYQNKELLALLDLLPELGNKYLKHPEKEFGVKNIITTSIKSEKISSQKLFKSAGFTLEPRKRVYGARIDLYYLYKNNTCLIL